MDRVICGSRMAKIFVPVGEQMLGYMWKKKLLSSDVFPQSYGPMNVEKSRIFAIFARNIFFFGKKWNFEVEIMKKIEKKFFSSFFSSVSKKCWKTFFYWFFSLKTPKKLCGRPRASIWWRPKSLIWPCLPPLLRGGLSFTSPLPGGCLDFCLG